MEDSAKVAEPQIAFWNRIPVKVGIGIILVSSAIFTLAGLILNRQEEQQTMGKRVSEAYKYAAPIAASLSSRMLAGGGKAVWADISNETREIADLVGAARIVVLTREGLVRADTDRLTYEGRIETRGNPNCPKCDSGQASDFPAMVTLTSPDGMHRLRIVTPIVKQESCNSCHSEGGPFLGLIAVDFDLSALDRSELDRDKRMLLTGLLSIAMLVGLSSLLFRWLIFQPITMINKVAQEIALGHRKARVPVISHDELGAFAVQFNRMAEHVEQQFDHIEVANMESRLFYKLVVEVSKNLEIPDMTKSIFSAFHEKLKPSSLAVFINEADERWVCCAGRDNAEGELITGEGDLAEAFNANDPRVIRAIEDVSGDMIDRAIYGKTLQLENTPDKFDFVMPFAYDKRLIGIIICSDHKGHVRLTPRLLNNLSAQLALAAGNSHNYMGSIIDPLTRLRNKRYGMARLDEAVSRALRYSRSFAIIMVDIDHFKLVNDSHGHPAGDVVLKEVARRIACSLRKSDIAIRYGGEEFMIIVNSDDSDSLAGLCEKIRNEIADSPVQLRQLGISISVTISVGCTRFRYGMDDGVSMIARADSALYRAKESGRNRIEVDI
ncbi:MAG: diguanylate cyclase [Georgfuchsia sp.]